MASAMATAMLKAIPAVCRPKALAAMPSPITGSEMAMYKTMKKLEAIPARRSAGAWLLTA